VMRVLQIVLLVAGVYGQSDVYWGSYELNIPGGSGAGNAVRDLKLPENAPEFFQFAAFESQPFAAPQFTPAIPSAPRPAPQTVLRTAQQPAPLTVRQQVRPAPQLQQARPAPQPQQARPAPQPQQARPAPQPQQARPAPQPQQARPAPQPQQARPAPQPQQARPAPQQQQVRTAPKPQQLRVFQSPQTVRQPQRQRPAQVRQPASRPAPIRQPAPRPAQTFEKPVQTSEPAQRFQNFAARTVERPAAPRVQPNIIVADNGVSGVEAKVEAPVDISDLSRFELYQLRQKLKKQKESQVIGDKQPVEVTTENAVDIQETTVSPVQIVPKRTRAGIRRKVARRKLVRNNA